MSTIEVAPATKAIDQLVLNQALDAHATLSERLRPSEVVDHAGFQRTEFHLGDESDVVSIIFRGREELPVIEDQDGTTVALTGPYERTLYTSGDDFGDWADRQTDGDLLGDPFERAMEQDSKKVEFVASSSPQGVIEAVITLSELGVLQCDSERLQKMKYTLGVMKENRVNQEIVDLYDTLFVACAVDLDDKSTLDNSNWLRPNDRGFMETVLALTGDIEAQAVIDAKREIVQMHDQDKQKYGESHMKWVEEFQERRGTDFEPATHVMQPGEKLSEDMLEIIADAHIVGVHTTPARPLRLDQSRNDGITFIAPTAEFYRGEASQYHRSTLHWSLNHPVQSHMGGDFSGRPFTIVAPFEGLARLNGAPAVLRDVDTYFSSSPGEGLFIPAEATIIEQHSEDGAPFIERVGNTIRVRSDNMTGQDMRQLIRFISEEFQESDSAVDMDRATQRVISGIAQSGRFRDVLSEPSVERNMDDFFDTRPERAAWLEKARAFYGYIGDYCAKHGIELERSRDDSRFYITEEVAVAALGELISGDDIEKYPLIQQVVAEGMREMLVRLIIAQKGGKNVTSDGAGHYTTDREFQETVSEISARLGLRGGLHADEPEQHLESEISRAISRASTEVRDPGNGMESRDGDFDWTKFDVQDVWQVLQNAAWPSRRTAIATGMMTTARKKPSISSNLLF